MKQLYFTSCVAEKSLSGRSGFGIRAASRGAPPDRLQGAVRYVGYKLPAGAPPETPPADAPTRLALLDTADVGRLLCHAAHVGQDPTTGRYGNFFSHALVDVPPELTARTAIESWGSPFWQRKDGDGGRDLPDAPSLPRGNVLGDAGLTRFLAKQEHRELLRFLLSALLAAGPDHRIFLAAPPEDVAFCIYGAIRCLPENLTKNLTFSSYERDPLTCPARIVGTCWRDGQDLPSSCYSGSSAGYNSYSGRHSPVNDKIAYVNMAVDALAGGRRGELDAFLNTCTRLGLEAIERVDLAYRIDRSVGELSKEDSVEALCQPALATLMVSRAGMTQRIVDWALDDPAYGQSQIPRLAAVLKREAARLGELADAIWQRGLDAIVAGDLGRVQLALEKLLPQASRARADAVWKDLLAALRTPPPDWKVRLYLTPRVVSAAGDAEGIGQWLDVPPDRLGDLLGANIPRPAKLRACTIRLGEASQVPSGVIQAISRFPELHAELIDQVAQKPDGEARGVRMFQALAAAAPQAGLIEQLADRVIESRPALFGRCLNAALKQGWVSPERLLRSHGKAMLARHPEAGNVTSLVAPRLGMLLETSESDPPLMDFLVAFQESPAVKELPPNAQQQLASHVGLHRFLQQPTLEESALRRAAGGLALVSSQPDRSRLGDNVVRTLVEQLLDTTSPKLQEELENVLLILGPAVDASASALYRRLLRLLAKNKRFWKRPGLLLAALAVGFGQVHKPDSAAALEGLHLEAGRLARQIADRARRGVAEYLEDGTSKWGKEPRVRWELAVDAVRSSWQFLGLSRGDWVFAAVVLVVGATLLAVWRFWLQ